MWADVAQSQKFRILGINLPKKGYIALRDFYKIWRGGGSPRSPPSRQRLPLSLSKMWAYGPKIAKNSIFW